MNDSRNYTGTLKRSYFEYLAYGIVFIVLVIMPLVFWNYNDIEQRRRIVGGWIRIFPFLIIFLVHNFWLLPKFLLTKRLIPYFISTLILIFIVNYLFIYNEYLHEVLFNVSGSGGGEARGITEGIAKFHSRGDGHHHIPGKAGGHPYWRWHNPPYLVFTYNVIISILVVGFNTSIRLAVEWFRNEQQRRELEKETIQTQLSALQHQVSPHFFMNTLNNIHALIDYSREDAKEAILRLSKMMRYLLYDLEQGMTSLTKEIEFLNSYIDLMRLRIQKSVELKINFPLTPPDIEIPPFLFIAFIENAFKYGIHPRGKSFIRILLEVINNRLHFTVCNSKVDEIINTNGEGGIGIENTRKRLNLLYGSDYKLNIFDREKDFEIDLLIPVR